jgi:secretion/DNA translocation related TadE-like protein
VSGRPDPAVLAPACSRPRCERGAGSVLVLAVTAAVAVVLAGSLVVVAAVRDAHRARSAADLGALAAARGPAVGGAADCGAAAAVTAAGGAELRECRALADGSVLVEVGVPSRWAAGLPGLPREVTGLARAGPQSLGP